MPIFSNLSTNLSTDLSTYLSTDLSTLLVWIFWNRYLYWFWLRICLKYSDHTYTDHLNLLKQWFYCKFIVAFFSSLNLDRSQNVSRQESGHFSRRICRFVFPRGRLKPSKPICNSSICFIQLPVLLTYQSSWLHHELALVILEWVVWPSH